MPPAKHDLSVVLGYIRSLLKPAPKTPHASLASSGMPKALWHCFRFLRPLRLKWLLTPQLGFFVTWNKARKPHDINRKSCWLRKEIVSHIKAFKRPYKNKQGYLFWWTCGFQGQKEPKSLQSPSQFQMSHIEMSQRWLLLFHWHTHTWSPAEMLRLASGHSCSSS